MGTICSDKRNSKEKKITDVFDETKTDWLPRMSIKKNHQEKDNWGDRVKAANEKKIGQKVEKRFKKTENKERKKVQIYLNLILLNFEVGLFFLNFW